MKDRHGVEVNVGDIIRVLEISPEYLACLTDDERPHVQEMLNGEFAIDEFSEPGKASVSIQWSEGEGLFAYSGLSMLPHEFELVRRSNE